MRCSHDYASKSDEVGSVKLTCELKQYHNLTTAWHLFGHSKVELPLAAIFELEQPGQRRGSDSLRVYSIKLLFDSWWSKSLDMAYSPYLLIGFDLFQ